MKEFYLMKQLVKIKVFTTVFWCLFLLNNTYGQSICFSSHNDFTFEGSANAQCIEYGDFDNDGVLDIVEGNFTIGTNKMFFIKGNPDGTFEAPTVFEAGSRPLDVKAYDFNNDNNLDVVVANQLDGLISIAFGNGDGTFQAPTQYTTNTSPNDIGLGDFNEDGAIDIAVTCLSGGFDLFFGSLATPGTFPTQTTIPTGAGSRGIVVDDFDLDNNLDVATANNSGADIAVVYGDGNGGFGNLVDIPAQAGTFAIISGDFNQDNLPDIAATNETANSMTVCLNSSAGFGTPLNYPTKNGPNGIKTGDFNEDGKLDIALVAFQDNVLSIFKGGTNGTFFPATSYTAIGTPRDLVVYDCDGDNKLDVVVSTNIGQVLPVFLGLGNGDFKRRLSFPAGNGAKAIDRGDFNSDGKEDIIVANRWDNNVKILVGQGNGVFANGGIFSTDLEPVDVAVGDVNNDFVDDVVTVNYNTNNVSVFIGDGIGGLISVGEFLCNSNPVRLKLGDVNNDSNLDIVTVNSDQSLNVLFGSGTGIFSGPNSSPSGNTPSDLELADFNGDNFLDAIFTLKGNNKMGLALNNGSGGFGAVTTFNVGTQPSGIAVGDFNNDMNLDVVVSNYASSNFTRLLGNGAGMFSPAVLNFTSTDSGPTDVIVEDFNNDGNLDVLGICEVSTASTGYATIFTGAGSGAFTFFKRFSTDMGPVMLTEGDWNGDGRMDAASVNTKSKSVSVFINTTAHIIADGPTVFCGSAATNLVASIASSYNWSTSETTQTISPNVTGDYFVETTTGFSSWCTSTSNTINVTVIPAPELTVTDDHTICQGQSTTLTVSGSDNYIWSDGLGSSATVTVTPTASHTYYVSSTGVTGCTTTDSVVVTVTGTPDASFATLSSNYCQDEAAFDLNPTTGGGVFSGPGISGTTFDPALVSTGPATITYTIDLGGGCVGSTSQSTNIAASPNANFSGLLPTYCLNDGGSTLNAVESGGDFYASSNIMASNSFVPSSVGVGVHDVEYVITNISGCTSSTVQSTEVFDVPDASFTGLAPSYCASNIDVTLVPSEAGGVFSGPGISGTTFNPSNAQIGLNTIIYEITNANGCTATSTNVTEVMTAPDATFTGLQPSYCIDGSNSTLNPTTSGGTFTGPGMSGDEFVVSSAGIGTHTISYTIDDGSGCANTSSEIVTVYALPDASFTGLNSSYCASNEDYPITVVQIGGTFSGPGINGTNFNPSLANIGSNTIFHAITDENGCYASSFQVIDVTLAPDATFSGYQLDYCIDGTASTLTPNTTGGVFSGSPGVIGNTFDPQAASVGVSQIIYTIDDGLGCVNSETVEVTVHDLPDASFTGILTEHCNVDQDIEMVPVTPGGSFVGDGVSGNFFNPFLAGIGMHSIDYIVTDQYGCYNQSSVSTTVVESTDASFSGLLATYCANDEGSELVPLNTGGVFTGPGVNGNFFNPATAGSGSIEISYEIGTGTCINTETVTVIVNDTTNIQFSGLDNEYCQSDNSVSLWGNPSGGTFFGSGMDGNVFHPNLANAGLNTIEYSYTNVNGCKSLINQTVNIVEALDPSFTGLSTFYCSEDQPTTLVPASPGGVFTGTGIVGNTFDPGSAILGFNVITYSIENGACISELTKYVQVSQSPDNGTSIVGVALSSDEGNSSATYQWVDCETNQPIDGATERTYIPTETSNYAVIVTLGNCSSTSECVGYNIGIDEIDKGKFSYYPNPTTNKITINVLEQVEFELIDATGRMVYNKILPQGESQLSFAGVVRPGVYRIVLTGSKVYKASPLLIHE